MAKITTKKPGQGSAPKESITTPILEAEIPKVQISKPVETSAVPARNTQPTPKSIPQVKVTRTAEIKLNSFSPPPPPPLPPVSKPKSGRLVVALGGVVLILLSLSKLGGGTQTEYDYDLLAVNSEAREMLVRDDRARMAMVSWKNQEPGFFGRIFKKLCLGYAKSEGCSSKPLHPFEKLAAEMGITLNFEKEEDKKVIEQTIEYKSRAFTLGSKI